MSITATFAVSLELHKLHIPRQMRRNASCKYFEILSALQDDSIFIEFIYEFFSSWSVCLLKSWNWKILIKKRNVILILYKFVILFNLIIIQNGDIVEESFHYFNRIRFISIIISQNCKCKNIRTHLFYTFL